MWSGGGRGGALLFTYPVLGTTVLVPPPFSCKAPGGGGGEGARPPQLGDQCSRPDPRLQGRCRQLGAAFVGPSGCVGGFIAALVLEPHLSSRVSRAHTRLKAAPSRRPQCQACAQGLPHRSFPGLSGSAGRGAHPLGPEPHWARILQAAPCTRGRRGEGRTGGSGGGGGRGPPGSVQVGAAALTCPAARPGPVRGAESDAWSSGRRRWGAGRGAAASP